MEVKSNMEHLIKLMKAAALMEKYDAIETYGNFNSLHEAFGVSLEEWQEAKEELKEIEKQLQKIWIGTRRNDVQYVVEQYKNMYHRAILAAAECVQIAAVALKFIEKNIEKS